MYCARIRWIEFGCIQESPLLPRRISVSKRSTDQFSNMGNSSLVAPYWPLKSSRMLCLGRLGLRLALPCMRRPALTWICGPPPGSMISIETGRSHATPSFRALT